LGDSKVIPLSRARALYAYKQVVERIKNESMANEYKSLVKKAPMYVKNNGLASFIAFLKSKKKSHTEALYEDIIVRLQNMDLIQGTDSIKSILTLESSIYRGVTNETIELLSWMSRFVDALIEDEIDGQQKV
jgi:CRISPR type III-B/RAMP module-associated protein Cmr5